LFLSLWRIPVDAAQYKTQKLNLKIMPLGYKVKKRVFAFDKTKAEKYVATAQRNHTVSYEDILQEVAKQSRLNNGEVYAAIEALIEVSITFMKQGHGVRLGDFGIFKPTFSAASQDTADTATVDSIKRKHILFQPGKKLREFIGNLSVVSYEEADTEPTSPGGGGESGGGEDGGGGELT
jgi:predicted histone-like DNA-binding protein